RLRQDALDSARLETEMARAGSSHTDVGTAVEREQWMTATGISVAAIARAASCGPVADALAADDLTALENGRLVIPHESLVAAVGALHRLYLKQASDEQRAVDEMRQATRQAMLEKLVDERMAEEAANRELEAKLEH